MVYTKIVTSDNLLAVSFPKKEVERELIVTQLEWDRPASALVDLAVK